MAFGSKNKKRESWSSRPLSMILSDNVWLFNKKNRGSVEKAMHQAGGSSGRQIEPAASAQAVPVVAAPPHVAAARKSAERSRNSAERVKTGAEAVSGNASQSADNSTASSGAGEKKDAPPFLTLNLDSSTQRLDVPEQYLDESVISEDFYSQSMASSEPEQPEPGLPESVLGPLTGLTVTDATRGPTAGESAESQLSAQPEHTLPSDVRSGAPAAPIAVPAVAPSAAKSTSASPDLVFSDHGSEPASQQNSTTSAESAARESTIDSSLSGSSLTTVDAGARRNSYLLGSNRKVVVGRGVYIFDPAEPSVARDLQLTASESFNPFEFD